MSWRELKARLNRCALDGRSPEAGWSRRRRSFWVCLGLPDPPARATAAAQLPSARLAGRTSGAWRAACEPLAEPRSSRRAAPIAPQTEVVHGATVEAHFLQPLKPAGRTARLECCAPPLGSADGPSLGARWRQAAGRAAPAPRCTTALLRLRSRGSIVYCNVCACSHVSVMRFRAQGCLNQRAIEHTLHHLPRRGHVQAQIRLARRAPRGAQASWRKRLHTRPLLAGGARGRAASLEDGGN